VALVGPRSLAEAWEAAIAALETEVVEAADPGAEALSGGIEAALAAFLDGPGALLEEAPAYREALEAAPAATETGEDGALPPRLAWMIDLGLQLHGALGRDGGA
jgi:hypothetical protein